MTRQLPRFRALERRPGPGRASVLAALLTVATLAGCGQDSPEPPDGSDLAGGATTVFDASSNAFRLPAPNLSAAALDRHRAGDAAFDRKFITAPAAPFGGLGPIFNNTSCSGCHIGNGRGPASLLLRISAGGRGADGGPAPVPGFGLQVQDRAVLGRPAEARVSRVDESLPGAYADGTSYVLHRPVFQLTEPYAPLPAPLEISPRIAPPVFGLGLLEAVPEADLLARADANDRDGDGISGRPNYVADAATGGLVLGRFGWKANEPNLRQQSAGAYNGDMGITTPLFPVESCAGQFGQNDSLADDPEIGDDVLDVTTFYVQTLGVPARRGLQDPDVLRGERLFGSLACASCHAPTLTTGAAAITPELARQTIHPFTDLLLHDMGEGLADNRPDYEAGGREWRTPPLWGLGLLETVNGPTGLLHDGRAATLEEAILWHGGEADAAREAFRHLKAEDRAALLRFLKSL